MKTAFLLAALVRLVTSQGGHEGHEVEASGHEEAFEAQVPFKFYSRLSYYTPKDMFASVVVEGPGLEYVPNTKVLSVITTEDLKDIVVPWGPLDLQYRAPKFFNVTHAEFHFPLMRFPPQAEPYPLRLWITGDDGKPLCNLRTLFRVLPPREAESLARQDRLEASILVHKPPVDGKEAQAFKPPVVAEPGHHLNPDAETKPPVEPGADGYLPTGWWLKVLPATVHQTTWDHVQKSWEDGSLTNWLEDIHIQGFNVIHPTNGSHPTSVPFNAELKYHVSKLASGKDMFVLYEVDFVSPGHNFRKYFLVDNFPDDYVHGNYTLDEDKWEDRRKRDDSKIAGRPMSHDDGDAKAGFLPPLHKVPEGSPPFPLHKLPEGSPPFPLPTEFQNHAAPPSGVRITSDCEATAPGATVTPIRVTVPTIHVSERPHHASYPDILDKEEIAWKAADTLRRILDQVFAPYGTQQQPSAIKLKIAWEGTRTLKQIVDSYFKENHDDGHPPKRPENHPHSEAPAGFPANRRQFDWSRFNSTSRVGSPANRRQFHWPQSNSTFRNGSRFAADNQDDSTDLEERDDSSPSSSEGDVHEKRSPERDGDDWFQAWNPENVHHENKKPHGGDGKCTHGLSNEEKAEIMLTFQRTLYNMLHGGEHARDLKTPTAHGQRDLHGDVLQAFEHEVRSTVDSWFAEGEQ